jgi:large subunit ribosomal protein L24
MKSSKPRKQRKARYEAPLHVKQGFVIAHIGKELREKLKTKRRSLQLRKGDRVKVMRGEHRGKDGKVARVDIVYGKAYIEGIVVKRGKGGEVQLPIDPSKLLIIEADFSDKMRRRILDRSKKIE